MPPTELDTAVAAYITLQMNHVRNAYTILEHGQNLQEHLLPEYLLNGPVMGAHDGVLHTYILSDTRWVGITLTSTTLHARFGTEHPANTSYFRPQPTYPEQQQTAAIEYNYESNTMRKMIAVHEAIDHRPTLLWHPGTEGEPTPATIATVAQEMKLFLQPE